MPDLHALLGDRYDAVIDKAAATITGETLPYFVARVLAGASLAAVLPDLLAEAWGEGMRAGYEAGRLAHEGRVIEAADLIKASPYRTEETDRA